MSGTYECDIAVEALLAVLTAEEALAAGVAGDDEMNPGDLALVIGDPDALAYAIIGTGAELAEFARRLSRAVAMGTITRIRAEAATSHVD
jgi:hypothetical protein